MKRLVIAAFCLLLLVIAWNRAASAILEHTAQNRLYSDPNRIPYRRVALVLGCAELLGGGQTNPYFKNRIRAATQLFAARKTDYFLVSGDNHTAGYDEPTAMKNALIAAGIPENRVVCDYAGFRTLDSVIRARKVFGQTSLTVVSQPFHNERAIFLAHHQGIDAIGFNAAEVGGYHGAATHYREQLAKMSAVLEAYVIHTKPRFLGSPVTIGAVL